MSKYKTKTRVNPLGRHSKCKKFRSGGFTLIELLVVLSIMGLLMAIISINLVYQRAERDLNIAQNELTSNLRKTQSYSLSGRQLPNGFSAYYYVVRFNLSQPDRYTIQGLYDIYNVPKLVDVETVVLPKDVAIQNIIISRPGSLSPSAYIPNSCALLAFRLPFGKLYADAINSPDSCNSNSPQVIQPADRYNDFLTFITNVNSATVSTDFTMTIILKHSRLGYTKQIQIQGITGNITSL